VLRWGLPCTTLAEGVALGAAARRSAGSGVQSQEVWNLPVNSVQVRGLSLWAGGAKPGSIAWALARREQRERNWVCREQPANPNPWASASWIGIAIGVLAAILSGHIAVWLLAEFS